MMNEANASAAAAAAATKEASSKAGNQKKIVANWSSSLAHVHLASETMMTNNFYKCGKTQTNVISDFNLLFNWNTNELLLLFTNTDRCTCLISISMPKATCDPIAICVSSSCFSWVWLGMRCLLMTYFLTSKRRPGTLWSNYLFSHKQQQQ